MRRYWISTSFRSAASRSMLMPFVEEEHHPVIRLGRSEAVDARHRRDDERVAPLEQRARRGVPHPVDLFVDRRFLLDVGVGLRDVRLRLVVVVVRDEVLDGVVREEPLELLVELRRQRLVVREHERRGAAPPPTTCAIVNVLPEPVTPSRTWSRRPSASPRVSCSMARGWSPVGWNVETISKGGTPSL